MTRLPCPAGGVATPAATDGTMQTFALTLDKFLEHAAKWHAGAEVVTARADGAADRQCYAAVRTRARRVSALLAARGVCAGERVATLAWNSRAHLEAWYGIMGMGSVCHTLNPRLAPAQLASQLQQSAARLLIASADLAPLVEAITAHPTVLGGILFIDGVPDAARTRAGVPAQLLETALATAGDEAAGDAVVWGGFPETAPSALCFTSGTTGAPKGVTYTHRSSYLHTLHMLPPDAMGITASDAVLAVVPMFHANGWGLPFVVPAVGGKLVLPGRRADGASLAALIRSEEVTVAAGVSTVWLGLAEHLEASGQDLPTLTRVLVGGAPLAPALMERLERQLGVTVQTSWGMTELSPTGTMSPPSQPGRRASASGRPSVGVDLLLTDAHGRPLPEQRGAEGYLRVRGASVVERYFGHAAPATDAGGWLDTGDLARIEPDGSLLITGRAKDLIKSGGEWINPAEIEAIVGALPQVSLAAVIGRPDPKWGERPILLVETRRDQPISDQELLAPLRGRVASWCIPDTVVRVPSMPVAPTGKIDKMRLRTEYGRP